MRLEVKEGLLDVVVADAGDRSEVYVVPVEAHIGAAEFDEKKFLEWLKWVREEDRAFLVFVGDNFEFATRDSVGDVYTQKKPPEEQMEWAVEVLTPLANEYKILGMISGNHEERCYRATGIDPTKWVARVLGVPYLSDGQGIIKVRLGKGPNGKPLAYTLHVVHGRSGSRTPGGKLNAAWRTTNVVWNADVYISAHTHGLVAGQQQRFMFDVHNNMVRKETFSVVVAGSFLSYGNYAKRAVMPPLIVGAPKIRLCGRRKEVHILL